jgi:hypothetical protein
MYTHTHGDYSRSLRSQNNSHAQVVGEPPYVLLVSTPNCWSNDFWAQPALMSGSSASSSSSSQHGTSNTTTSRPAFVVNGIGPDKNCLLDPVQGESFMNKAKTTSSSITLHPWTERPEFSSLTNLSSSSSASPSSSVQELFHLFCECNVSGVFAEAVATAVQVAAIGCPASTSPSTTPGDTSGAAPTPASSAVPPEGGEGEQQGTAGVDCADGGGETSATNSVSSSAQTGGGGATPVYVPVLSFLLGVASTLGVVWYWNRRPGSWLGGDMSGAGPGRRRRRYRIGSTSLGEDDDDYRNHDLELT